MRPYLIPNDFDLKQLCDSTDTPLFTSGNLALYVQNESPSVPTNHGIGVLADAISCSVKHQVNGQDELVMIYPDNGQLADKIEQRCLIVADVERRGNQPYRIYRIAKDIQGKIKIYARHLAYDLGGIVVEPFSASDIQTALNGLKTRAMTYNPFTFTTTRTTGARFSVDVPSTVWSLMGGQAGSLLDVYGGEYLYDGYTVSLENRIGSDTGVSVRYGVNMTDFSQDENCANCYTGVVAYWRDMNGEETVYSPVVNAVGNFGYVRIMTVDMSSRWEEKPTKEQLRSAASSYITRNQIGVPKVSWKINFIPLETTEEYKNLGVLERVNLGDTVGVKFEKIGVDATARVNEIEWDVLRDKYISVSLGSVKSNIADTIAKQTSELAKTPSTDGVKSIAMQISNALAKSITGASGGSVRLLDTDDDEEPDTLYIADNPDPAQARKVWRFNYNGWAASQNGYNGPFVMGATLNDGLLADFVTAANLVAGTIKSADGNTFYLNLDTGEMRIGGYAKSSDISDMATKTELATAGSTVINGGNITTGTMTANRIRGGTLAIGGINNQGGLIDVYDASGNFCGRIYNGGLWIGGNENGNLDTSLQPNGLFVRVNLSNDKRNIADITSRIENGTAYGVFGLSKDDGTVGHGVISASAKGSELVLFSSTDQTNYVRINGGTGVVEVARNNRYTILIDGDSGTIKMRDSSSNTNVVFDGSTGRIDCKSLYINGTQVTP